MIPNFFKLITAVALLSSNTDAWAQSNRKDYEFYKEVYVGQHKRDLYAGPYDPRGVFNDKNSSFISLDNIYYNQFFYQFIQPEVFNISEYWSSEIVDTSACPNELLSEHIQYIRYLYRLVSISYLVEGLKLNNKVTSQLGNANSCKFDYNTIFGKCNPKTDEMKKFQSRAYGKFANEFNKLRYDSMKDSEKKELLESFKKSNSLTSNPVFSRIHQWCKDNKKNCRKISEKDFSELLGNVCNQDIEIITRICSEEDDIYGMSKTPVITDLILNSNVFNLINKTGTGQQCIRRFGEIFKNKERNYVTLDRQIPIIYGHLVESKSRYLQGDIFVAGALREFDEKGLSDFLTALTPPKPIVVKPKPKPKPAPKPEPKPVIVVEAPKPVVVVEAPVPVPVEIKISEFEFKSQKFLAEGKKIDLDMKKFNEDFSFTEEMIAQISGPIEKFQTRNALVEMKAYDDLGSINAPVGLIFIKYLLDTNNHQGLHNIINVLGDKFYVINDIEGLEVPHRIHLRSDESTKYKWQITFISK